METHCFSLVWRVCGVWGFLRLTVVPCVLALVASLRVVFVFAAGGRRSSKVEETGSPRSSSYLFFSVSVFSAASVLLTPRHVVSTADRLAHHEEKEALGRKADHRLRVRQCVVSLGHHLGQL
jgi:hypothetical protein